MDVLNEVDVTVADAIEMLNDFGEDPFLEENAPAVATTIRKIAENLTVAGHEISVPECPPEQQEVAVPDSPRRRKHRHREPLEE